MNDARTEIADDALDEASVVESGDPLRQAALDDPRGWESDEPVTEPMSVEELIERRARVLARKDAVSFSPAHSEPSTRALTLPAKAAHAAEAPVAKPHRWANLRRSFEQTSLPRKASVALIIGLVAVSLVNARRRAPEASQRPRSAASASAKAPASAARALAEDGAAIVAAGAESASSAGAKAGPTLQREAADAVLSGDLKRALTVYRRLAESDPGASVYQEAVRVIEARLEKGGRTP